MKSKRNKISNLLKLGILLFGISLFLNSCEKEKNNHHEHQTSEINYLNIKELPEIASAISGLNKISSKQNKSTSCKRMSTDFGSLNLTNILEYANKEGQLTYSFLINKETSVDNPSVFENLHLVKLEKGYLAYILKWEPDQEWFKNNNYVFSIKHFTGKQTRYDINYKVIQVTDFTEGHQVVNSSVLGKQSKSMDVQIICEDEVTILCYDTGADYCGGSICGFGYTSGCFVSGGSSSSDDTTYDSNTGSAGTLLPHGGGGGSSTTTVTNDGSATVVPIYPVITDDMLKILDCLGDQIILSQLSTLKSGDTNDILLFLNKRIGFTSTGIETNCNNIDARNFVVKAINALNDSGEVDFEDQIINKLTGKAKCVYGKLKSSSITFKDMIKKFDGEFPVSHLNLIMEDLGTTRGETRAPDGAGNSPDYVITVALNSNSNIHGINYRPNLMSAKTIAHEVIHAEMYRKILSVLNNGGNISGVTIQDVLNNIKSFPGIYDYYRRHRNWQHQQMATHYRQTIADILKGFDNNQHPNQFYLDVAWEGLKYPSISTWSTLSSIEQNRINKVINDYIAANKNETCQ